jgi:hypothetical protein
MALRMRYLLRRVLAIVALATLLGSAAMAQLMREHFGELELSTDAKSWRIERPAQHLLTIVPIGTMAKTASPVLVTQAAITNFADCEVLARAQLPEPLYHQPEGQEVEVGGLKAVAVHAQTRCRNATPTGIALCIPHRGIGYVLTNRIGECRMVSGSPFSGSDWFDNLTKGIRFAP